MNNAGKGDSKVSSPSSTRSPVSNQRPITDNERWLLSFYRESEISGSLFFGRLSKSMPTGPLQADLTRHFADEAQHARYWTDCLAELGTSPARLRVAYQDRYLEAVGLPVNMMEVLAITQVFERRVIAQYARHSRAVGLPPAVETTFSKIMADEKWHLRWVREALGNAAHQFGADTVTATVKRCTAADEEVYRQTLDEYAERLQELNFHA